LEDLAARTLRLAVRALPRDAAPWGRAMVAELAAIDGPAERRRFVLSCVRVVLTCRPAVRAALPRLALTTYGLVALLLAARVPSGPARFGAIAVALVLTIGCGVTCGRFGFGPAGHGRLGRWFRVGGLAVIGAEVLAFLTSLRERPGDAKLWAVVTGVLAVLVVAVVRVTARRSAISRPVLGAAVGAGLGAAALWTAGAVAMPHMPSTSTPVLVTAAAAGVWAVLLANARQRGGDRQPGPVAALLAPAIAAHVIALVISTVLPLWPRWIPHNAPPAIGPYRLDDPIAAILLSVVLAAFVAIVVPVRSAAPTRSGPTRIGPTRSGPDSPAIAEVVE
jgi:hypothetical protein